MAEERNKKITDYRIAVARKKGWTYIHTNKAGLVVGIKPPPADNHEFWEIPKIEKAEPYTGP